MNPNKKYLLQFFIFLINDFIIGVSTQSAWWRIQTPNPSFFDQLEDKKIRVGGYFFVCLGFTLGQVK